ncbi:PTPRD [Cordylochernes scorpioides]|uniref:PTPRD n=1 Tax=Cordylochernes scorpioides TaxID=51811 RepID=A0ABY6KC04_9ARAC|nr:PTPRD [Cordylochernes scorpioides]
MQPGSAPRNVQGSPLSASTVVVQWDPPKEPNGQVTGYKVYYTTRPNLPTAAWSVQAVDNNQLTTISDLTHHTIYTIRVQAFTSRGPGPLSSPVQVKTQQGVPSQPSNLRSVATTSTSVQLTWTRPAHPRETIVGYVIYWNDTFTQQAYQLAIPNLDTYTLQDLDPDTLYYVWVAAKSRRGEGPATAPPPCQDRSVRTLNGPLAGYGVRYAKPGEAWKTRKVGPEASGVLLSGLEPWTTYRVQVWASTEVGGGPATPPILAQTEEGVPGEPRQVVVSPLSSTGLTVAWQPPANHNGLIRGYQLHVQELTPAGDLVNEPARFDVADPDAAEFNVTGLQPDTEYGVQVAAVTRRGDGTRSRAVASRTLGGVPTKPELRVHLLTSEAEPAVQVEWTRPAHTYGQLLSYRLRYGRLDQALEETEINPLDHQTAVRGLEQGSKYMFRLAGRNAMGWGQEAVAYLDMPEGGKFTVTLTAERRPTVRAVPTAPPQNLSHRLQSPTTVVVSWDAPLAQYRNGRVVHYGLQFLRSADSASTAEHNTTVTRMVFSSLDENTEYVFRVRAYTAQGAGPWSSRSSVHTPGDVPPAPTNVQAMATSDQSVEVWWDTVPYFLDILGYQVLYTQTAVEDLDQWSSRQVPLTSSAELTGLDSHAMYAVRVAAVTRQGLGRLSDLITVRVTPTDVPVQLRAQDVTTHSMALLWKPPAKLDPLKYKITYGSHKEFYDSQGLLQELPIPPVTVEVERGTSFTIDSLMPFTSYQVNITAVPPDLTFRPPARITVTTAMAAPKPMVKPDTYGLQQDGEITVILPQASEEYGPISHYLLAVVPDQMADREPDHFTLDVLESTPTDQLGPYIAAKFMRRAMPNMFSLGDGKTYLDYPNRRLQPGVVYRVFVRAVVDTPLKSLYTSSPFSDGLSLELAEASGGPGGDMGPGDLPDVSQVEGRGSVAWVLGPVLVVLVLGTAFLAAVLLRRKHHLMKAVPGALASQANGGETTMKLLVNHAPERSEPCPPPSDPVELRRLNFQTPGMLAHPPVPVTELAAHIHRLRADDNLKFSQEYESIDPGQQFTWENSNCEANKPKNRYANVVAYDHSRVVLAGEEDYINANYCDGYRRHNAYVATQGPLPETFADFWRMVWEQRSFTIVMVTKLEERTRIKCDQYWPSRGTEVYGVMHVTITDREEFAAYVIHTFLIQRAGSPERREVRQLQFTAWPDHGVPDHPTPFLGFLRRVRAVNPPEAGPVVVHCSAGVGRTGCFIVIDSMVERLRHERTVDIYGHVTCLRAQRNYMVQTEDQYMFIHEAVLEAATLGNSEVSAEGLYTHLQRLQTSAGPSTGLELEFKKLSSLRPTPTAGGRFATANLPVNKFKNRLMNILPYEATRVCLQPLRGVEGSDYINASFIDGYRQRGAYIATQGPMAETTEDLWRMLWEHNSNIVVMLVRLHETSREKCHQYWPGDQIQRYLYFVVEPITEYNMPQYILREFKVTDARDGQSRTVRQFQFTDWPDQGVPKSGEGFIDFIGQVHKTKEQFGQEGPITVHCSGGAGRTGVFITLSIVLERMQHEGVLDLLQTVHLLRTQRPGMVQTLDQYHFCYRAALEYLGSFDNYAN